VRRARIRPPDFTCTKGTGTARPTESFAPWILALRSGSLDGSSDGALDYSRVSISTQRETEETFSSELPSRRPLVRDFSPLPQSVRHLALMTRLDILYDVKPSLRKESERARYSTCCWILDIPVIRSQIPISDRNGKRHESRESKIQSRQSVNLER